MEEELAQGDVLYVAPLTIIAPEGVHGPLQANVDKNLPDGLPSDFLQFRMQADQSLRPRKSKSSAIRDYPDGCAPCVKKQATSMEPGQASRELKKPRIPTQQDRRTLSEKKGDPLTSTSVALAKADSPVEDSLLRNRPEEPMVTEVSGDDAPGSTIVHTFPVRRRTKRIPSKFISKLMAPSRSSTKAGILGLSHTAARKLIIETLRLFDGLRRHLMLEDEQKSSRLDLVAGKILTRNGLTLNQTAKRVGIIPGLEVGDIFYFRMELSCAGMHGPIQAGIDYLNAKESKYGDIVAISIISSGGYDAKDEGDELIYTGQGGKSGFDSKPNDQKLERGNLAMKESMKHRLPVRVIRGVKDPTSPSGKTYTYDGLYKVENFWSEKGKSGFEEFKFKLQRLPDQEDLGSAAIKLSEELRLKPSARDGLKNADMSGGLEAEPVCVVNTVDDELCPAPFKYTATLQYQQRSLSLGQSEKCACKNLCNSSKSCSCLARNGNVSAYVSGLLVNERVVIHECGRNCNCSNNCTNKTTQKSSKPRLEVFKTCDRGWGLRCQDSIPAGTFVCEYTGQLVEDLGLLIKKDYLLDSGILSFGSSKWGDVSRLLGKQMSVKARSDLTRPHFMIDASSSGNMARFINHSCSPNLLVQCVVRDGLQPRMPHATLFAMDNIPPFRELTIDYGTLACSSGGQAQGKVCKCKSVDCRGRFGF